MLSIGIVAAGGVGYYLDTVGSGVDDYYVRSEPGAWLGSGARAMGLDGLVDAAQVDALAGGVHPRTGERLGIRVGKVAAFDLTFSAPKSVSVLGEIADPRVRDQVRRGHDRAVEATMAFLEDAGVLVGRRGPGGAHQVGTIGAVAAGFVHRSSRAGDPQLHTHVLVFNRAEGVDGRWGGIHGRRLFAWAKTAGYVYQASLRAELSDRLGVEWRPVVNGTADLAGITDAQLAGFSTRRDQIETALHDTGFDSPRAAQLAALATRPARPGLVEPELQRHQWRQRAEGLGLHPDAVDGLIERVPGGAAPPEEDLGLLERRLAGPAGLTEHRSVFDRRDVVQAVAAAAAGGAHADQVAGRAGAILNAPGFVSVDRQHPLAGPQYSTKDLVDLERAALASVERRSGADARVCTPQSVEAALSDRPSLSGEQTDMVRRLCTSSRWVDVVIGRAGTGKTFALDAARAAWADSGVTVIGAALAARTAAGLEAGTGIPSTTVDALLLGLDRPGPDSGLPRRGVLVVDEAGMVGTRKLAALLEAAERSRTKVVLVGDQRQLPEVEAGGLFAALARDEPIELTVNRRQTNAWERGALDELRHGDVGRAVTVYRDRQRITLAPTADDARSRLVADWYAAQGPLGSDRAVMIALHQADVEDLNRRARHHLRAAGQLADDQLEAAGRSFALGDRVVSLHNDRRIGVTNGTRATVTSIDTDAGTVVAETSDGRRVSIPAEYLRDGHLTHGYALTAHKAQGITVARAFVLGSDRLYREAGYTALSRATDRTDLYQVAPPSVAWQPAADAHHDIVRVLSRSAAQTLATPTLATQTGPPNPPAVGGQLDLVALRDAALADPGSHLLDRLGPPPTAGAEREAWAAAATAIDAYRHRHHVTGPDPLGAAPSDPEARRQWDHARVACAQVERHHQFGLDPDHHLGL